MSDLFILVRGDRQVAYLIGSIKKISEDSDTRMGILHIDGEEIKTDLTFKELFDWWNNTN